MSAFAKRLLLACLAVAGASWPATPLSAQVLYGSLVGAVTDSSGAAVPGASITITGTETNLSRSAVSNETGAYSLTNVPAGPYDVAVSLRPVYPLAVRVPDFFKRTNPLFPPYVARDSRRVAQREGIPFRFPRPDPIVQDMRTLEVAERQPYIRRLTRLGAAAQIAGHGLAFADEISRGEPLLLQNTQNRFA